MELDQFQEVPDGRLGTEESKAAAFFGKRTVNAGEGAQSFAVHETDRGEIDLDRLVLGSELGADEVLEMIAVGRAEAVDFCHSEYVAGRLGLHGWVGWEPPACVGTPGACIRAMAEHGL